MFKLYSVLRDEDKENGNGGGEGGNDNENNNVVIQEGDELDPSNNANENEGGEGGEGGEGTTQAPPKKTQTPDWSPEKLTQLLEKVVQKNNRPAAPVKAEPQMTQEQMDKLLNPVRVTREGMAEILGIEDPATISDKRLNAFQSQLLAVVKNSTSVANLMVEQRMRKLMQEAAPMQEFYQQQAAKQYKSAFFERHPKIKKYEKFVQFAATQVSPTTADGQEKTVEQAMDDIAGLVKQMLGEAGVDIDRDTSNDETEDGENLSGAPNVTHSTPRSNVPKMTSLQTGGRNGGATGKNGGKNDPDADIYSS